MIWCCVLAPGPTLPGQGCPAPGPPGEPRGEMPSVSPWGSEPAAGGRLGCSIRGDFLRFGRCSGCRLGAGEHIAELRCSRQPSLATCSPGLEPLTFRWEVPRRHLNTIHVTEPALSHSPWKQQ